MRPVLNHPFFPPLCAPEKICGLGVNLDQVIRLALSQIALPAG